MSETVERVARALCKADGFDNPDLVLAINDGSPNSPRADIAIPVWRRYRTKARAAIEAMREPTEAMKDAGALADDEGHMNLRYAWIFMIDEALK